MYKRNLEVRSVLLFLILVLVLSYIIEPSIWLDLFRYYQYADDIQTDIGFVDFVSNEFETKTDVIYYVLFYLVKKLGLPIQLVTCVFCTLYYILIIYLIEYYKNKNNISQENRLVSTLMMLSSLMACGPILVFTISRQLVAVCFILLSIIFYLKRKYCLACILLLTSLMTHIGVFIYLWVLCISLLIWKFCSNKSDKVIKIIKIVYVSLIIYCIVGGNLIQLILAVISSVFGTILPLRYVESYLQIDSTSNIIQTLNSFVTALPVLLIYLATVVFILFVKKVNFYIVFMLCLSFFMIIFSFSIPFLGQRLQLLLPVTYYMMLDNVISNSIVRTKRLNLFLFMMFGILCCYFFEIYLYRNLF